MKAMKKKTVAVIVAVALVALAVPVLAFAGVASHAGQGPDAGACVQPVLTAQAANVGQTAATCPGYADADQDGVCDNYGTGAGGQGNGYGQGYGAGNGCGHGRGCMRG